jgi:hypothetical protein
MEFSDNRCAPFHRCFATLALFTFTLRRLGATLAIERGRLHVEVDLTVDNLPKWNFPIIVALRSIAVLVR